MDFRVAIEKKLSNSSDSFEVSKILKCEIKRYFATLDEQFISTQGKAFMYKHSKHIDLIVDTIYKAALRIVFKNYVPLRSRVPIVLVALGSYGREQLCVHSDIDLMIVYKETEGYNLKLIIEKVLYLAWDAGLKLGHRVHEIDDLKDASKDDITIKSAMLESRLICGSKTFFVEVVNALNKVRFNNQKEYIFKKLDEHKNRISKNGFCMQPEIKEGFGGIRDANSIYWIGSSLQKIDNIENLQNIFFSEREYREFRHCLEFLFRVRSAMHLCAGKKQDRFIFDLLPCVANKLGINYTSEKKSHIVCSQKTLEALRGVAFFSSFVIAKMVKKFFFEKENIKIFRSAQKFDEFYLNDNILYCSFKPKNISINKILNVLNALPDKNLQFDVRVVYIASKIEPPKMLSPFLIKAIKKLFYRENIYRILAFFYESKLLYSLFPPFLKVIDYPQFDGYHKYPVDFHSIKCMYYLENIQNEFIKSLYNSMPKERRAILRLVLLMHDVGKGREKNHSLVGEGIFRKFAIKLGFSEELASMGSDVIKIHTLMSYTAYNQDIYEEKTMTNFASKVKNRDVLDMLYVVTYADVNGVETDRYTTFLDKLLYELYHNTIWVFDKKEVMDTAKRRIKKEDMLKKDERFLSLSRSFQKKILSINSNLFFLKFKINEILDFSHKAKDVFEYAVDINSSPILTISIIRAVPLNLGYLLGKLSYLNVASMDIYKLYDDKKLFVIEFYEGAEDEDLGIIEEVIKSSFDMSIKTELKKPKIAKKDIELDEFHSKRLAKLFIETENQKGLLAYIASIFDELGIDIVSAKANTHKNRVKDLFLIEKNSNFCNNKSSIIKNILR